MKNANECFGSPNGTEHYYLDQLSGIHYTDGVNDLLNGCKSWWFMDLIFSHQANAKVKCQFFQVWDLTRVKDNSFKVVCSDGNNHKVLTQKILFSDFPYDQATIWLIDGVMLLPVEY